MESRNEKFRRIMENRLSRVFSTMSLIENLSNKRYYDYTVEEINEIFQAYMEKGLEIKSYFEQSIKNKELSKKFVFNTQPLIKSDKSNKFRKLAEARMTKVFIDMNLIANLSNLSNYSYDAKEIKEVSDAYKQKGFETRGRFIIRNTFTFRP